MNEDYRSKVVSLMQEVEDFKSRKDVQEEIKMEADTLYHSMDKTLMVRLNNVEDEYIIIQNFRVKFQAIKNKVD